jgi:hypothetical protein
MNNFKAISVYVFIVFGGGLLLIFFDWSEYTVFEQCQINNLRPKLRKARISHHHIVAVLIEHASSNFRIWKAPLPPTNTFQRLRPKRI